MRKVASATPLMSINAVALNTETTGLDVEIARVIRIGAVRIRHGRLQQVECFDTLVNPGLAIPSASSDVHKIQDDDVRDAPDFNFAAARMAEFCGPSVLIGHNIGFDLAVLRREYLRNGMEWQQTRTLDTLLLTRIVAPVLPDFSLDTIASWLGISITGRHTALGDALATGQIFIRLIPALREQGVNTLAEAEAAMRSFADAVSRQAEIGWVPPAPSEVEPSAEKRAVARLIAFSTATKWATSCANHR